MNFCGFYYIYMHHIIYDNFLSSLILLASPYRLIAATEDAFTHIRRTNPQDTASSKAKNTNNVMNPEEASQVQ